MKTKFAFVRNHQKKGGGNLKLFSDISSAESHAKRKDATSQERQVKGRSHTANYFWSKAGEGLEGGGADYGKAYRAHKKEFGITTERKGAALGNHLLVGVSPEFLTEEGGDPRSLENPRVQLVIAEAKKWAESWMGEGAVWAVRYDTDEKGSGIVDIIGSPIREAKHKSGKSKSSISVRKAVMELQEKHGLKNAWAAQQTDWAQWAQANISPDLKRGTPKKQTDRENVSPEAYAAGYESGYEKALQEAVRAAQEAVKAEREEILANATKDAESLAEDILRASDTERRRNLLAEVEKAQEEITELKAEVGSLKKLLNALERILIDRGLQAIWEKAKQMISPKKSSGFQIRNDPSDEIGPF